MENNDSNNQETYSLAKIKEKIIEFNLDETIDELKKYYATPTTWEIINQARKEESHTKFLSWIFGNEDFNRDTNNGPIKKLIILLLKWAKKQGRSVFNADLEKSIYNQELSIDSYSVKSEYSIYEKSYKGGRIDILIECEARMNTPNSPNRRKINIIIENKIDARETTKDDKALFQTDAYYNYFEENFKDDINLFVFLKPTTCDLNDITEVECNCKEYIQINYQELLDNIIQPISEQKDISEENRFKLKDYIKALGKPATIDLDSEEKITIIAMEKEQKDLLETFFKKYQYLIRAALYALNNPELSSLIENIDNEGKIRIYTINGEGSYSMYQVLEEFIKFRLSTDHNLCIKKLDTEIRSFIGKTKSVKISDDQTKVEQEGKKAIGEKEICGHKVRYTKQWSDGGPNPTFTKFREGVSKKYPNFQIKRI